MFSLRVVRSFRTIPFVQTGSLFRQIARSRTITSQSWSFREKKSNSLSCSSQLSLKSNLLCPLAFGSFPGPFPFRFITWPSTLKYEHMLSRSTSSSSKQPPVEATTALPKEKLTMRETFKKYFKLYRWWFVATYATIYFTFFGVAYLLVVNGVDVVKFLAKLGAGNVIDLNRFDSSAGKLVQAFMLNKLAGPVRLTLAFALTPALARLMRRYVLKKVDK